MVTINDMDIFVLSYNRAHYIKEMIKSLLNQTVGSFEIKILDNGSNDNTKEVINSFNNKNLLFIGSEQNNGALWNFQRVQKLATKKYTIMFHDDDVIHPKYLEYVVKALNEHNNVSMVCSGMKATTNPNKIKFKDYKYNPKLFNNISEFASLIYLGFPLNYATVVYKTKFLKKIDMLDLNKKYGKIADRPTIYEVAKRGNIVLFPGQYIHYRIHNNQDSANNKTGPFEKEIIALHKYYKQTIYSNDKLLPKIFFLINFYKYINSEYERFYKPNLLKKEYISKVIYELDLSNKEIIFTKVCDFLRIGNLYKIYRFLKRSVGEYS